MKILKSTKCHSFSNSGKTRYDWKEITVSDGETEHTIKMEERETAQPNGYRDPNKLKAVFRKDYFPTDGEIEFAKSAFVEHLEKMKRHREYMAKQKEKWAKEVEDRNRAKSELRENNLRVAGEDGNRIEEILMPIREQIADASYNHTYTEDRIITDIFEDTEIAIFLAHYFLEGKLPEMLSSDNIYYCEYASPFIALKKGDQGRIKNEDENRVFVYHPERGIVLIGESFDYGFRIDFISPQN